MAQSTLSALAHPEFPQLLIPPIELLLDRTFAVVDRAYLPACEFEEGETSWGAGDGFGCTQRATVSQLEDRVAYCLQHHLNNLREFRKAVRRG